MTCRDLVAEGLGVVHINAENLIMEMKPLTGFVWGILPGETGVARIMNVRKGIFEGVLVRRNFLPETWHAKSNIAMTHNEWALTSLHQDRVSPDCDIFGECGGCKLRHLTYENGVEYKKKWLETHFTREKLPTPGIEIIYSPETIGYRNHVQVHQNKYEEKGFYMPYSYKTKPFPDHGCRLFPEAEQREKFPLQFSKEKVVRIRFDHETGLYQHSAFNSPSDKNSVFTYTFSYPNENRWKITIPNTVFFQVNTKFIPVWLRAIQEYLQEFPKKSPHILELFSGFGFITRTLQLVYPHEAFSLDILSPREINRVEMSCEKGGISLNEPFLKMYLQTDINQLTNFSEPGRDRIREFKPDIILLNPARAGFTPENIKILFTEILQTLPRKIIYSSCNASTFGRDAKVFSDYGYQIGKIQLLDFFPYTSHFEVLTQFTLLD